MRLGACLTNPTQVLCGFCHVLTAMPYFLCAFLCENRLLFHTSQHCQGAREQQFAWSFMDHSVLACAMTCHNAGLHKTPFDFALQFRMQWL